MTPALPPADASSAELDAFLARPHFAVCDQCGRKSWLRNDVDKMCRILWPGKIRCEGTFRGVRAIE